MKFGLLCALSSSIASAGEPLPPLFDVRADTICTIYDWGDGYDQATYCFTPHSGQLKATWDGFPSNESRWYWDWRPRNMTLTRDAAAGLVRRLNELAGLLRVVRNDWNQDFYTADITRRWVVIRHGDGSEDRFYLDENNYRGTDSRRFLQPGIAARLFILMRDVFIPPDWFPRQANTFLAP